MGAHHGSRAGSTEKGGMSTAPRRLNGEGQRVRVLERTGKRVHPCAQVRDAKVRSLERETRDSVRGSEWES